MYVGLIAWPAKRKVMSGRAHLLMEQKGPSMYSQSKYSENKSPWPHSLHIEKFA